MQIREQELIVNACDKLSNILGRSDVSISISEHNEFDHILCVADTEFGVIVRGVLTNSNLPFAIQQARNAYDTSQKPIIFVLGYTSPTIMQTLCDNGISVIDYAGNCMIKHGLLCVNVSGQKNTYRNDTKPHTLSESAIKLIFRFLSDRNMVGKSYRVISRESGMSLGTIKNTIDELANRHFVIQMDKGRRLANYARLLELWVQSYNQVVRPKILLRRMRFRTPEMRNNWQGITLPEGMSWGGDCGANLADGYLFPGSFEIYTSQPSAMLMTTGVVLPDDNGEITLYQKFWDGDDNNHIAPRLIIYADLLNSGDSRQIEAAQRLIQTTPLYS